MNVAFIPVRGGSKSIPLKNIKEIAGKPLVYWTTKAANECKNIDKVYVATDSEKIRVAVETFGFDKVSVIDRSADSASDTASTESAMIEFAQKYDFENIVLIQATSPLLLAEDLEKGFIEFGKQGTDSVLSVVRQKRFHWDIDDKGNAHPTNYDVFHRPRRQEFDGYLVENGAFYITSKKRLLDTGNRISGNIHVVEMDENTYFEIDEPSDWVIIEHQLKRRLHQEKNETIPEIKMFLTDCDGVLTDGGMYYSENGDELKKFNTKDGMGFQILREHGIITGIITGEDRELNRRRAQKLKLDEIVSGCKDKVEAIKTLCKKYGISPLNVCYIGDDVNDLEAIKFVGFGCCVADGNEKVKEIADYITKTQGGRGVVREVVERILIM